MSLFYLSTACQADIFIGLDCVVKCILHLLKLFSKLGHVLGYHCWILLVHHNALDKISNLFHLAFLHAKARSLWYPYPHATRVHIVSACLLELFFDGTPVAKLSHIYSNLV